MRVPFDEFLFDNMGIPISSYLMSSILIII